MPYRSIWVVVLAASASLPCLGQLTISEIQGSGATSPFDGNFVSTSGVVTQVESNGFFLQDPVGDGDAATSDGIFVFTSSSPSVSVGDAISLTGQVNERQFFPALAKTQLRFTSSLTVVSTGNALPAPVTLSGIPDGSLPDGIAYYESLEGMRVTVSNAAVVGPTNGFGEVPTVGPDAAVPGSGFQPASGVLLVNQAGSGDIDYNPERIIIDNAGPLAVGDSVDGVVGALDYDFGIYKVVADTLTSTAAGPPIGPIDPVQLPPGDLTIGTFNLENLFDTIDNPLKSDGSSNLSPGELDARLTKLAAAIRTEMALPALIITQESENQTVLQQLGDRVNAAAGTDYVAIGAETSDARGIEVGFLYDDDRLDLVEAFQLSESDVAGVEAAFGSTSASPGREPLVGVFDVDGEEVTVIGNHFKSKGGDDDLWGVNQPPNRPTETQRALQATVIRDYLDLLFADDPDGHFLVGGDLNDFPFAEPGEAVSPIDIILGTGPTAMIDLSLLIDQAERYTFIFDGNAQMYDYLLASPALAEALLGIDIAHINADYPDAYGWASSSALRSSDHDPVVASFAFRDDSQIVPSPTTAVLGLIGLVGVMGLRRSRLA